VVLKISAPQETQPGLLLVGTTEVDTDPESGCTGLVKVGKLGFEKTQVGLSQAP
jgi:hypothetical protein